MTKVSKLSYLQYMFWGPSAHHLFSIFIIYIYAEGVGVADDDVDDIV